jgi:hypothetical protein
MKGNYGGMVERGAGSKPVEASVVSKEVSERLESAAANDHPPFIPRHPPYLLYGVIQAVSFRHA